MQLKYIRKSLSMSTNFLIYHKFKKKKKKTKTNTKTEQKDYKTTEKPNTNNNVCCPHTVKIVHDTSFKIINIFILSSDKKWLWHYIHNGKGGDESDGNSEKSNDRL